MYKIRLHANIKCVVILFLLAFGVLNASNSISELNLIFLTQGNNFNIEKISFRIAKTTSDKELKSIKEAFNKKGIDVSFSNIKRNEVDEIYSLTIEFKKNASKLFEKWNINTINNAPIKTLYLEFENDEISIASKNRVWKSYDFKTISPNFKIKRNFLIFNDKTKTEPSSKATQPNSNEFQTKIQKDYSLKKSRSIGSFEYKKTSDSIKESKSNSFIIIKSTSRDELTLLKKQAKASGIDIQFLNLRRNKAGEIISIKIYLTDNNGRTSNAFWEEKSQAIPDIIMGKSKDDTLFVRAIDN